MFEIAININKLKYYDLPCNTLAERLKKAKLIGGFSQKTLAESANLSLSTINELEAGYRDNIKRYTLTKLLRVLDMEILCDDYCNYILNQENEIEKLLHIYSINKLSDLLNVHRSTIERWSCGKYQISRNQYKFICMLKDHEN